MARTARKPEDDEAGVIKVKDFDLAKRLYVNDIKPAKSRAGEAMQEASTAYKQVKKQAHIQPSAMKAAVKVLEMEDAKRDDWLRCFNGFLTANNVDPDPKDMVDAMQAGGQADDGYARPKISLVTLGEASDGTETDLADAADDGFDEVSEEELAMQAGRGGDAAKDEQDGEEA